MDVQEQVKGILQNILDVDPADIKPQASLMNDLGASSVDLVEIIAALENTFDVKIPDADATKLRSVQAVVDYVQAAQVK